MEGLFSWQSPSGRLVLEAVLSILIEVGYDGLTMTQIRARSGAAARALDDAQDLDVLVSVALEHVTMLEVPPATGSLRGDLEILLRHWRRPRTRNELVLAAVLSATEWHPGLRHAVARSFDRPITNAVGTILSRATVRPGTDDRYQTLGWLLRGLMLERLRTGARSGVDLDRLVDFLMAGLANSG